MGVDFRCLTGCATLDVLCDEQFHIWPPEVLATELDGFCDSGVSGRD